MNIKNLENKEIDYQINKETTDLGHPIGEYDPLFIGGCRAESQQRTPRFANGCSANGLCFMDSFSQA